MWFSGPMIALAEGRDAPSLRVLAGLSPPLKRSRGSFVERGVWPGLDDALAMASEGVIGGVQDAENAIVRPSDGGTFRRDGRGGREPGRSLLAHRHLRNKRREPRRLPRRRPVARADAPGLADRRAPARTTGRHLKPSRRGELVGGELVTSAQGSCRRFALASIRQSAFCWRYDRALTGVAARLARSLLACTPAEGTGR